MPDSDQCTDRQQSCGTPRIVLAVLLVLGLAGCAGQDSRPGPPHDSAITTPPPPQADAEPPLTAATPAPDVMPLVDPPAVPDPVIWARLRAGFALGHIKHPRIEREISRLQRSPNAFRALLARSEPYIHHILNEIGDAGLPTELALLPAIESGFRAHVYSPDGAAGLWQFMPATGQMLGLGQDWWFDKRRTVRQSTHAAIVYLDTLNRRFHHDWLQTLAAYNAGAGTVNRAIRQARRRGDPTDFWSLDLPGETDRYVPRLLALARVVADPDAYGLDLPDISDTPYFELVDTAGQIDLNVAAGLAGIPADELLALNAGHKRWASHPDGPHVLLLPVDRVDRFEQGLATLPAGQRLRWRRHLIRQGDSLSRIAQQYSVSISAIQQANGLKGSRIRAGRHLLIPLSDSVNVIATTSNQSARQRLHYRVRRGDSLYTIARRFQVTVADLKRWNRVGRYIQPGERLTVFIDPDA